MITAFQLATKVEEMLDEQQKYFKSRDILQLQKCKRMEKEVRTMLTGVKAQQNPKMPSLFYGAYQPTVDSTTLPPKG